MELKDLESIHKYGVELLQERGYYERLISEIQYLLKYIDNNFFLELFSENLFDDMRGVFISFVRQDLRIIYQSRQKDRDLPLSVFLDQEFINLNILLKCTSNLRYQVKSLSRMPQVKQLQFKSSFILMLHRKLNGEIQALYKTLSENYKQYFRGQFSGPEKTEGTISLGCLDQIHEDIDQYFLSVMSSFYQISDALRFVQRFFKQELEAEIRNRIANIFFEHQDRLEKIMDYFIDDLKKNFIRTMDRHQRSGKSFEWIERGFEKFIYSTRFEKLLRRVIYQTLAILRDRTRELKTASDIF
ncbi:MAG: hypothetical protein Kow0037_06240 [Calditrichia bacterium]